MRALSEAQASACETATGHVCRCRCHGTLHGGRRAPVAEGETIDRAWFSALPDDDPHYLPPRCSMCGRKRKVTRSGTDAAPRFLCAPCAASWAAGIRQLAKSMAAADMAQTFAVGPLRYRLPAPAEPVALWPDDEQGA